MYCDAIQRQLMDYGVCDTCGWSKLIVVRDFVPFNWFFARWSYFLAVRRQSTCESHHKVPVVGAIWWKRLVPCCIAICHAILNEEGLVTFHDKYRNSTNVNHFPHRNSDVYKLRMAMMKHEAARVSDSRRLQQYVEYEFLNMPQDVCRRGIISTSEKQLYISFFPRNKYNLFEEARTTWDGCCCCCCYFQQDVGWHEVGLLLETWSLQEKRNRQHTEMVMTINYTIWMSFGKTDSALWRNKRCVGR